MDGHNYRDDMWRLGRFLCTSWLRDATYLLGTSKLDLWLRALVPSFLIACIKSLSVWLHATNDEYQANDN